MAGNGAVDGLLSVRPSLPLGLLSQSSSVRVPLDSWAHRPARQLNGTCCFWAGTSHSGGDPPSRVRPQPAVGVGGGLRMTDPVASDPLGVSEGLRGISPKTFILSLDPIAAKAVQRFEPGGDGSMGRNAPRQRFLLLEVVDKKVGVGPGAGW